MTDEHQQPSPAQGQTEPTKPLLTFDEEFGRRSVNTARDMNGVNAAPVVPSANSRVALKNRQEGFRPIDVAPADVTRNRGLGRGALIGLGVIGGLVAGGLIFGPPITNAITAGNHAAADKSHTDAVNAYDKAINKAATHHSDSEVLLDTFTITDEAGPIPNVGTGVTDYLNHDAAFKNESKQQQAIDIETSAKSSVDVGGVQAGDKIAIVRENITREGVTSKDVIVERAKYAGPQLATPDGDGSKNNIIFYNPAPTESARPPVDSSNIPAPNTH